MKKQTNTSQRIFHGYQKRAGCNWLWYVAALGIGISGASLLVSTAVGAGEDGGSSKENFDAPSSPPVHFAQTTFDEMLAFHLANPNVAPTVPPFLTSLPPSELPIAAKRAGDTGRVGLTRGTTEPGEAESPVQGGPGPTLAAPTLIANFAGTLDNGTSIPPDTHGAVGPAHVVNMLNTGFQVFDRTGVVVAPQISLQAFWAVLGIGAGQPAAAPFDPKILYDQYTDRWVVVTDSNGFSTNTRVLVGISHDSDPTGGWNLFAIDPDPVSLWADFPGLGVDAANVYVSNNMFTLGGGFSTSRFWVISKASMIAGGPLNVGMRQPSVLPGATYQPAHSFDNDPGGLTYFVNQGWQVPGTPVRAILLNRMTGIGAAAVLTELGFIEVAGYNFAFLDAPQSDCATAVETNDARMQNAVLRNGKVWATHTVGDGAPIDPAPATKAEVAWYEMDPSVANINGPYLPPIQQGHVENPTLAYYFPSIAVNAVECVALGFSGSDAATFASAYYTMRDSTDAPGTMQSVSILKAGVSAYHKIFGGTRNRWGDYSATMVDPLDDLTFWTTQEYAESHIGPGCAADSGRWGLWWGSFQCAMPPPLPIVDQTGFDKTRFISFLVPAAATAAVGETALRVNLVSLHHVVPPYTGGASVQFTAFEYGPSCGEAGGCVRWVGPPTQYVESNAIPTPFYASSLQCVPYYQDWSTVGLLHVTGSALVPSSIYEVENVAVGCAGNEENCLVVSAPLSVNTTRWGDVEQPYNPPETSDQPDTGDISALVNKFKSAGGAPIKSRALLAGNDAFGNITTLNVDVGFDHISACVDAFKGKPYPHTIAACP